MYKLSEKVIDNIHNAFRYVFGFYEYFIGKYSKLAICIMDCMNINYKGQVLNFLKEYTNGPLSDGTWGAMSCPPLFIEDEDLWEKSIQILKDNYLDYDCTTEEIEQEMRLNRRLMFPYFFLTGYPFTPSFKNSPCIEKLANIYLREYINKTTPEGPGLFVSRQDFDKDALVAAWANTFKKQDADLENQRSKSRELTLSTRNYLKKAIVDYIEGVINEDTAKAIDEILNGLWNDKNMNMEDLRDYFPNLQENILEDLVVLCNYYELQTLINTNLFSPEDNISTYLLYKRINKLGLQLPNKPLSTVDILRMP